MILNKVIEFRVARQQLECHDELEFKYDCFSQDISQAIFKCYVLNDNYNYKIKNKKTSKSAQSILYFIVILLLLTLESLRSFLFTFKWLFF